MATVAVYSEPDRDAPHVHRAGEAYLLGPGPAGESYLVVEKILDAARKSGAEAIHPGYGFLAENAAFARACDEAGIVFIGPPADAIDAMGSKTRARELMQEAGVPIVPGTTDPVETVEDARKMIDDVGRLPGRDQGRRRRRRQGLPRRRVGGRAREGLRGRSARGREVLLRRHRLHRALPARPAPRRGAGARRRPRQRHPPLRARLLGPAPPPEADRGVAGAGGRPELRERIGKIGTDAAQAVGYRSRRNDRGPAPGRRVLLPRDEHARAGRALRDRDGHRHRHRPRADPDRRRRAARLQPGRRRAARPRDRVPHQRRGRVQELRARAGQDRRPTSSPPAPACASTPAPRRATRSSRCTTR